MNYIDELIDYLIDTRGCDTCAKCVNFCPWTEEEEQRLGDNLQTCKATINRTISATAEDCREGMKAWYRSQAFEMVSQAADDKENLNAER